MTQIPAAPTFADNFVTRASQFADDALRAIPELAGVAVVPSWRIPQSHVTSGIARFRSTSPTLEDILVMLMAHQQAFVQLQGMIVQYLGQYDEHAGKLAEEIRAKTGEIEQLDRAIAERQATLQGRQQSGSAGAVGDPH